MNPNIIKLIVTVPSFLRDIEDIIRAFSPHIVIDNTKGSVLEIQVVFVDSNHYLFSIFFEGKKLEEIIHVPELSDLDKKRYLKREVKNKFYNYISNYIGITLPYGSLTGVRPTNVYRQLGDDAIEKLTNDFGVNRDRANLISAVVENQKDIYLRDSSNICIYINIPACPSRCKYCSFSSNSIANVSHLMPRYVDIVCKQIRDIKEYIRLNRCVVKSIYIGGGTPTCIELPLLEKILLELDYKCEFTVEAGRADTISIQLLDLLADNHVTRVSINPQTFSQRTLKNLNRNTSLESIYNAFNMVKKYNFIVNADLILGLEDESTDIMTDSLTQLINLNPDNITIHSLSIKKGSHLYNKCSNRPVLKMDNYSLSLYYMLKKFQYLPYYMYRQKNTADNLENIGFAKKGKECIYNVLHMEDVCTILSCGAGGITKIVNLENNYIERQSHPKDFNQFLNKYTF